MNPYFSLYTSKTSTSPTNIHVEEYIQKIKHGHWQDHVIKARAIYQKEGKSQAYTDAKSKVPSILGSCTMKTGAKVSKNLDTMNGLLCVDIDDEQVDKDLRFKLQNDKHTHILHKSISGINYCLFIKIDPTKFEDTFLCIADYFLKTYSIHIDISCKNKNRLRFVSWDEDIYYNEKSNIFRATNLKRFKAPKKQLTSYIFTQSDFDNILGQIKDRGIDLCREDYYRYVSIGMAFANEFGASGEEKFHFVCSFGSKYNAKHTSRDYDGFCKRANRENSIGTFYYYCKEEGIDIYSQETKDTINMVKVGKSQGKPTVDSISKNIKVAHGFDPDEDLVKRLIDSKEDYSRIANEDVSEIQQIENFIVQTYTPTIDIISKNQYVLGDKKMTDFEKNDIYLACKKSFDFTVQKNDVNTILKSSAVKKVDALKKFFNENKHDQNGYIEKYASAIYPQSDYNLWCFKKWMVGAIHNWMSPESELLVCPLTLVLTGQGHGIGKTSFLRNIMPDELRRYFFEGTLDRNNADSMFRLASNLVVFDDEFGGKALKDVTDYKSVSDSHTITQRRPYGTEDESFKRRAILCGTTNETDILKDVTGNRRILPIKTEKIDYDLISKFDTVSLIVEAYNLWRSGFDWKIYKEEDIKYLSEHTQENNVVLPVEEMFFKFFSIERTGTFTREEVLNQGEILNLMLSRTRLKATKYDIKDIIVKNRLEYKPHRIDDTIKKGVKIFADTRIFKTDYQNLSDIPEDEVPF